MNRAIAGILLCLLAGIAGPAWSQSQTRTKLSAAPEYALEIPKSSLVDALKLFSTQTGLQIGFWPDAHTDQSALVGPLTGKFTAEVALTKLLALSGLTYRRINERALVVIAPSLADVPRNGSGGATQEDKQNAKPNLRQQNAPLESGSSEGGKPGSSSPYGYRPDETEEVVVVGSRRGERSGDGPSQVSVIKRARIEQIGANSTGDVLRYFPQQTFNRAEFQTSNTTSAYAQLRGLGMDSTLVLLNNRRVVPTSVTFNAFDLNSIPVTATKRVELLSDSASAIYGADAMGGVVNIMLDEESARPALGMEYGGADDGADMRRVWFTGGFSTDRFRSSLIADYYERDLLFGYERDRLRNQDFRRFGGSDYRLSAANPGTISSMTGANLPGLSAPVAAVPEGSDGIGLTPADFAATAGQRNYASVEGYKSIVNQIRRTTTIATAEFDLASELTAFAEVLYAHRRTLGFVAPYAIQSGVVPAANPFNPFGQSVRADFLLTGIGPLPQRGEHELARGLVGLRGPLGPQSWAWEVSGIVSRDDGDTAGDRVIPARVATALASSDPAQALNPFVDGPGGSDALLASLVSTERTSTLSNGRQLQALVQGDFLPLPAGPVHALIGGEWRGEDVVYGSMQSGVDQGIDHGRDVGAGFVEIEIPVSGAVGAPRTKGLALNLAARYDHYSDFGDSTNSQFGIRWRPIESLLLRASYGTSFRPPSLFELYTPVVRPTNVSVRDPARGNEAVQVTFVTGGNPALEAIDGDSLTAGFVLSPSAIPDLRALATYWRVHQDQRVTVVPFALVLANEAVFADRVVRADPTAEDIAAGRPGRLMQVDITRVNFGSLDTSGVDLQLSYDLKTRIGKFSPIVAASWVGEYDSVDLPSTPVVTRIGVANVAGAVPRWRVAGTLAWERGALGLATSATWIPSYRDANQFGPLNRQIGSQTLVDVYATLRLEQLLGKDSFWSDFRVQAGVRNVFDKEPEFAEIGFNLGIDPSQSDLTQRFGFVKISKGF